PPAEHAERWGGPRGRDLQEERGLADAGVAPQQDHRPRDYAAAQDPVQFRLAAAKALGVPCGWRLGPQAHGGRRGGGARARRVALLERIPLTAQRALPLPLEGLAPAGTTHEYRIRASHRCAFGLLSARIRAGGGPIGFFCDQSRPACLLAMLAYGGSDRGRESDAHHNRWTTGGP